MARNIQLVFVDEVYGSWTVIEAVAPKTFTSGKPIKYWRCRCECGHEQEIQQGQLRCGAATSCRRCSHSSHGRRRNDKDRSPEYTAWVRMKDYCYNKNNRNYPGYGGRGISVCESWRNSFKAFLADVGQRPSSLHSIDRFPNNDGNYEPENVRWATMKEQSNNRRSNHLVTFRGVTKTVAEWSESTKITQPAICSRLKSGWSIEDALTRPLRITSRRQKATI